MADSLPPSSRPAAASTVKRPWYLVFALSIAFFIGATSTMQGCQTLAIYQGAYVADSMVDSKTTKEAREQVEKGFEHYTEVLFAAKERMFPITVASWVLGLAIMAFAMRALSGSGVARGYMLQVLSAKGALMAAEFWLTRDVSLAELEWYLTLQTTPLPAQMPASMSQLDLARAATTLAMKLFAVAAILIALTRTRTKAFYEAALTERNSSSSS